MNTRDWRLLTMAVVGGGFVGYAAQISADAILAAVIGTLLLLISGGTKE